MERAYAAESAFYMSAGLNNLRAVVEIRLHAATHTFLRFPPVKYRSPILIFPAFLSSHAAGQ